MSSFVEFIMNSGYPTMLYIASACDKYKKKRKTVNHIFSHQVAVLGFLAQKTAQQNFYQMVMSPQSSRKKHNESFSHLFFCCFFCLRVHPAHILQAFLKGPFNFSNHIFSLKTQSWQTEGSQRHIISHSRSSYYEGKDFEVLTMALLSSAKVALTNMAPRAKPRALSVSLTHSFQRGVQLCNIKSTHPDTLRSNASTLSFAPLNNI